MSGDQFFQQLEGFLQLGIGLIGLEPLPDAAPDVRPEEIPPQVWEWAQQEGSLVSAYRKWEILELKDELAALEMNQKNRRAAVGPAQSDGEPSGVDPVTLALLGR